MARLRGHTGSVENVAVSPDGRHLLSCSGDRSAILWDRETGRLIRRLGRGIAPLSAVAFSPDGRRILSGHSDRVVRLWDLESGTLVRGLRGHREVVFQVAFSQDGQLGYSTSGGTSHLADGTDSAVRVWDLETGREVGQLPGHRGRVFGLAVSPDGRHVLTGGDSRLILWDAETRRQIRVVGNHDGTLSAAVFLPDGLRAVSASYDRTVRIWDLNSGQQLHRFVGHPQEVTWVAASSDGRLLLSSDYNAPRTTALGHRVPETGRSIGMGER